MSGYVNDTDIVILRTLERLGELTQSELYYEIVLVKKISYQAMRNHVSKLSKYGYVEKVGRGKDARIRITENGKRLLAELTTLLMM